MTQPQLTETSGDETLRSAVGPDAAPWPDIARPAPRPSGVVPVVLSFGSLDQRALCAMGDALRAIPVAAREVAVSCDVGVRTFARTLTVRLWTLEGWRTKVAVEKLAASVGRSRGMVSVLSGDLAASAGLVDEAFPARDHVALALAPDDLARALDHARAALGPPPPAGDGPEEAAGPAIPARRDRETADRSPGQRPTRRSA